mmetsp:Transcript_27255/g.35750  ORF Transcript_27255/g.35750 Transcript_27255/m.35750 type:complete len:140 (-) Transcript_27255:86-505(-)
MKNAESHEHHHKHRMKMKKHHHHSSIKGSMRSMFERAKKAEHAIGAQISKICHHRRKEDIILGSHSMKQSVSIHGHSKHPCLFAFLLSQFHEFLHFAEISGLFDTFDMIIKLISFGKQTKNPWHAEKDDGHAMRDLRSH